MNTDSRKVDTSCIWDGMKYNSWDITKNIEQDDSIEHPRFLQEKQEKIPAF